jgi:hypothetical protein
MLESRFIGMEYWNVGSKIGLGVFLKKRFDEKEELNGGVCRG